MKLVKLFSTVFSSIALSLALSSQASAAISVDVSGAPESSAKGLTHMLGYLGIQPTGTVKANETSWCVFNDWKARDTKASANGHSGRYSLATTFGGKWYCYDYKK